VNGPNELQSSIFIPRKLLRIISKNGVLFSSQALTRHSGCIQEEYYLAFCAFRLLQLTHRIRGTSGTLTHRSHIQLSKRLGRCRALHAGWNKRTSKGVQSWTPWLRTRRKTRRRRHRIGRRSTSVSMRVVPFCKLSGELNVIGDRRWVNTRAIVRVVAV